MDGEGGDFRLTKDYRPQHDHEFESDEPFTSKRVMKILRKWAKQRKRADEMLLEMAAPNQNQFRKLGTLLKSLKEDSSTRAIVTPDGNLDSLEQARFHVMEGEKHRKKARERRSGQGVVSKAHGEALARAHDQMAEWHFEQARGCKVV